MHKLIQPSFAAGRARFEEDAAGLLAVAQRQRHVRRRQQSAAALRPFHQQQTVSAEKVAQPEFVHFDRSLYAIQIHVHTRDRREFVDLDQRISWTAHRAIHPQGTKQAAHAGGLAGAQFPAQMQGRRAIPCCDPCAGEPGTQGIGRAGVAQQQFHRRLEHRAGHSRTGRRRCRSL